MKASAMTIINSIFKTFVLSLLVIAQVHFAYAQNAAILPPAKTTFVDQNGKPLTLGKVDFYIPGTSTRKTTWQDADATIPNTNPVNLDSAGRALILGNGAYRQVVRDRNNNVVWDQVTNSAGAGGSGTTTVGDGLSVGSVIPWAGFVAPANYAFTYGQELNRVTYNSLFNKITLTQNITCTSGSPTITAIADTSQLNIGAAVEAACIPAGATILSKTINSVTLTANALVSTTVSGVFFPWGNGNGLTTFNVPDYRGYVLPGRNNMGGSASSRLTATWYNGEPNSIGGTGGVENLSLGVANLPSHTHISPSLTDPGHTHTVTPTRNSNSANSGNTNSVFPGSVNDALMAMTANSNTTGITLSASTGTCTGSACTGAAFSIVQPSKTVNYVIKIAPDISLAIAQCANITDAGTACTYNVGTSGATVPLNSSANTFSAIQTYTAGVNISGGASVITDLAAPTLASDAATKAYVDSVASGLNILAPSTLATAAVLPNSPTYSNGALGVGATLTAGSNTTLTVDGTAAPLATVVLVKNQASAFQNGVYTVTQAGSGAAPWILTRATYFDQAAEMKAGSYTLVTGGATNINSSFTLQAAVTTVGTDALNWVLFAGGSLANVVGSGTSTSGDLPIITNSASTTITSAGYNSTQIPGLIPTTSTVTISNASPGIVSWASHGLTVGTTVFFCTTGSLPTGLTACVPPASGAYSANTYLSNPTLYYVCSGVTLLTNSFAVASTLANAKAGTCLATSSVGSGTHTAFANAMACAGCIGEYVYNIIPVASSVALTSGSAGQVWNSISLSAGIWEVGGGAGAYGTSGSTVFTHQHSGLVYGFTTIPTSPFNGTAAQHVTTNQSNGWVITNQPEQIFLTTTTTLNGVITTDFSGGAAGAYGKIWARRIK